MKKLLLALTILFISCENRDKIIKNVEIQNIEESEHFIDLTLNTNSLQGVEDAIRQCRKNNEKYDGKVVSIYRDYNNGRDCMYHVVFERR